MNRTFTAAALNRIANHPDVRPWVGGEGEIDLSAAVSDEANYTLTFEGGGFVYIGLGNGLYEVHSLSLQDAQGVPQAARESLDWMFSRTDCVEVMTKVPAPNKGALGLVRICGFDRLYERKGVWTGGEDVSFWQLTLDRWAQRSQGALQTGKAFHDLLEQAQGHENHPEDDAHDHAAGAASLMFQHGQMQKACWYYNKWCAVSGYRTISLLSLDPPVMDIETHTIGLKDGALEVLECR